MSFVSLDFLVFVIAVAIVYFLLPGKVQWLWLLFASGYFYYLNTAWYQAVNLLAFLLINYCLSVIMSRQTTKRRLVFVCVLVFDVLYLLAFKYIAFFASILVSLGVSEDAVGPARVYLSEFCPMGISYIALIVIGYITDLYWENVTVQKNPGKFMLFSVYFPQVISGPLVKYSEYDNNLWGEKHKFSYDRIISGIERIIWGVFKKLVVSSRAGIAAGFIKENYEVYNGLYIPFGIVLYIIQLYSDFSGLMDIVIGVSEVLGIEMPENFKTPFYSESISEFWRRWHITLGRFLKDYVLFPMQTSKWFRKLRKAYKGKVGKEFERKVNLPRFLTMLVSWIIIGFWHGGGWNYIFGVGIYMWAIIILSELLTPVFEKLTEKLHINTECFSWHMFRRIRTFILYMYGVSFFWADNIHEGFAMWRAAFSIFNPWIFVDQSIYGLGLDMREMKILILGVVIMFIVSHINQKESVRDAIKRQNFVARVLFYLLMFLMIVVWGHYGAGFNAGSFIYGRF